MAYRGVIAGAVDEALKEAARAARRPLRLGGNNARRERAGSISGVLFSSCVSNETNTWNRRRDGPQNQPRLRIPWKSRCL
jgi:hypothetical protein